MNVHAPWSGLAASVCASPFKLVLPTLGLALLAVGVPFSGQVQPGITVTLESGGSPFALSLETQLLPGLPGLQSYAMGTHEGLWLLLGGRLDGLHRRQPWASFDQAGHNTNAWVLNPETGQLWSRALNELPSDIAEQLSATNPCFQQEGEMLYWVGGYGYSASADAHLTYPALLVIDVPGFIQAVQDGTPLVAHVQRLADERFAVTGGQLHRLGTQWMLVGGHRFDGLYNPMGHATHVQTYTDAVRRFRLSASAGTLSVTHLSDFADAALFHRRDYNLLPQIFEDGSLGLTVFSGVFRPDVDQPFLNSTDLDTLSWSERPDFAQYLNHYHCANTALYSPGQQAMHSVFFGGIAQYTLDGSGNLIQDLDVPFVSTIARVTRLSDGSMAEHQLPISMPELLGAGAEFISVEGLPYTAPGILDLDALLAMAGGDSVLIGHIFGGIRSPEPNVFWVEDGTLSSADARIFGVWLKAGGATGLDALNTASVNSLSLQVYPNPNDGNFTVSFALDEPAEASVRVFDAKGTLLESRPLGLLSSGRQTHALSLRNPGEGMYIVELKAGGQTTVQIVHGEF
ncbi:MAG: T9SS type A sorting domain-containing protein [Bacteroidetes bacterium]|nr:T9SS type A sorting domain-containing protein [Bacteroidota bacterium]